MDIRAFLPANAAIGYAAFFARAVIERRVGRGTLAHHPILIAGPGGYSGCMIAPASFSTVLEPVSGRNAGTAASREAARYDTELVRRCRAGDDRAFGEIVARYRDRVFSVALSMLKNRADAEEIAQDTFVRAHRALERFRGDSSLATWLHRIALNLARNRYWYFYRRRRHATLSLDCTLNESSPATFADLLASDASSPDRTLITEEFSQLAAVCLKRLEKGAREILALRNAESRSYGEIARMLGIKIGTVKSRIARARGNLRKLLSEMCPEFSAESLPAGWFDVPRPAGSVAIAGS